MIATPGLVRAFQSASGVSGSDRLVHQTLHLHGEHRETGEGIEEIAIALGRHGAALLAIGADLLRTVEQLRASVEHSRTGTVEVDHDRCALR